MSVFPYISQLHNVKVGVEGVLIEPRCEKTGLQGFRPGPTQSGL